MTPQDYNEQIDILTRKIAYEDDNIKKQKLSIQFKQNEAKKGDSCNKRENKKIRLRLSLFLPKNSEKNFTRLRV